MHDENVEEIFVLVKSCLSLMATVLFYVAKLRYESRSSLPQDECLERFVHGKNVMVNLPTLKKAYVNTSIWQQVYNCYLTPSDWQRVWERTASPSLLFENMYTLASSHASIVIEIMTRV